MKKLFIFTTTFLAVVSCFSQITPKPVIKQTSPGTQAILIGNNVSLIKFAQLRTAPAPLFKIGTGAVQNIRPVSASSSSTRLGKSIARQTLTRSNETATVEAGRYCTSALVSEEKGDYEKIVLGNQNDKIFPGAIYYDNSIIDGAYNAPVDLSLRPYQVTSNLFSAASSGSSFVEVQPNMGSVYNGIADLMRRTAGVINPAAVSIEAKNVYSSEQLGFFLQAGFQGYGVDLNAEFDYNRRTKQNLIFVKLKQVYFTVALNRPYGTGLVSNAPASVPSNLVYVNKVNYGRVGILKIESDSSIESIQAALDFTYNGSNASVSASARVNYQKTLATSTINGFFFGGDATNIVPISSATGLSQFNDYVRGGLRLNPNVAPTAISYELKYMNDNATAAVNSTTSYTERKCETAKGLKITLNGISIEDIHGGDCSYAWGAVKVEVYELDNRGVQVRRVLPVTQNLREENTNVMWNRADVNARQTGMINYASIRSNQTIDINNINNSWTFYLDPAKVASNNIAIKVITNINTNHKDNDIAALGFHGMRREETRTYRLNEVLVTSREIATRAKYGSMITGPYPSYSGSDRVHNFRAHFTVTTAQ
jgi:Thiol-activated cytolysin